MVRVPSGWTTSIDTGTIDGVWPNEATGSDCERQPGPIWSSRVRTAASQLGIAMNETTASALPTSPIRLTATECLPAVGRSICAISKGFHRVNSMGAVWDAGVAA